MTETLVIAAVLAFCAVLKAARDVMNDRWDSSVFATLSGGDDTAYFGHRDTVWLRRYAGRDSANPKLPVFRIPVVSNLAEGVWDFWHLTWSLQLVVVTGAFVWLTGLAWWWTLVLLALSGVVFELFYRGGLRLAVALLVSALAVGFYSAPVETTLVAALAAALAYVTRFDALGFPRDEEGGTSEEQRAFHRDQLYPRQAALFLGYALLAWVLTGSLIEALPWVASFGVLLAFATHDLGYWLWRLALGLNTWSDWDPLGERPYWKRWNLGYRVHAAIAGASPERPLSKRTDTLWRLVGLAVAVAIPIVW